MCMYVYSGSNSNSTVRAKAGKGAVLLSVTVGGSVRSVVLYSTHTRPCFALKPFRLIISHPPYCGTPATGDCPALAKRRYARVVDYREWSLVGCYVHGYGYTHQPRRATPGTPWSHAQTLWFTVVAPAVQPSKTI